MNTCFTIESSTQSLIDFNNVISIDLICESTSNIISFGIKLAILKNNFFTSSGGNTKKIN